MIESEVWLTYFDTFIKQEIACGAVFCDSAFGGESSVLDMDMGDDYVYPYTLAFFLSFSISPSFSMTLVLSLFFSVSLFVSFFHTHIEIHTTRFWMEKWVLRGMSWSVKCKFLNISWLKTLFLLMFGKVNMNSNTHPLTQFQAYPLSNQCHINTPFLRVRYQVKQTPNSHANTFYDTIWHYH